ncbi:MAG: amidophosphoribosyltransferase [Prevotella sp.]|nr:amidophosphoribosyltransferase [Prevotella sp.]
METLKHECGVAMIRLLRDADYYKRKYGTDRYALEKLYLMMEKQRNRGQEGAGLACVSMLQRPGHEYMYREKAEGRDAIAKIFASIYNKLKTFPADSDGALPPFTGEMYMGHLRYSTTDRRGLTYIHPFLRRNNWKAKNLCLCGNFNMTNVGEVFDCLLRQGQCPRIFSDGYIMLELMGHRLDREVERNYNIARREGLQGVDITRYIDGHVDMGNVLQTTMRHFDGGYVVCGLTGSGEMFAMRDPNGIRPAFFYASDELVAVASERPVLQTTFDIAADNIREINPGEALLVNRAGKVMRRQILAPGEKRACSFERIYFSRGNDIDIHRERKLLGRGLKDDIIRAVGGDLAHTVLSYIPNTAEVAYYGMQEAIREVFPDIRTEKVLWKDLKLRTFITEGDSRGQLAGHVYDITAGSITPGEDYLVVIDDSIVRGTTLRESILEILDRLKPKKIVVVSSAPQIRYPDFYGIDMPRIGDLIAFQACVALLKETGRQGVLARAYNDARDASSGLKTPDDNIVRAIYEPFTARQLSDMMVRLLRPRHITTPVELVFQSIEGLRKAIPRHTGDWYFTGHYPTPGGTRMLLESFISYVEANKDVLLGFI